MYIRRHSQVWGPQATSYHRANRVAGSHNTESNERATEIISMPWRRIKGPGFYPQQSYTQESVRKMSTFGASSNQDSSGPWANSSSNSDINYFDPTLYDFNLPDIGSPSQWVGEMTTANYDAQVSERNDEPYAPSFYPKFMLLKCPTERPLPYLLTFLPFPPYRMAAQA